MDVAALHALSVRRRLMALLANEQPTTKKVTFLVTC